jgi:hypothetical protein
MNDQTIEARLKLLVEDQARVIERQAELIAELGKRFETILVQMARLEQLFERYDQLSYAIETGVPPPPPPSAN